MIVDQVKTKFNSTITLNRYAGALILVITVIGVNYFYSVSMMFLTTFVLAYLTKGSRSMKKNR